MTDTILAPRKLMEDALYALRTLREYELGHDYNSDRNTVLRVAFAAEESVEAALDNARANHQRSEALNKKNDALLDRTDWSAA